MRASVTLFLVSMVLVISVGGRAGDARADTIDAARVTRMLSAYESMPSRAAWRALGADAVPVLIDVFRDTGQVAFRRVRALTALACFDDPRATAVLAEVASDDGAPGTFRRAALLALAQQDFGTAMPLLERSLAATDPKTRQIAVKALAESTRPEARRLLERHRVAEREPFLVERVERALQAPARPSEH